MSALEDVLRTGLVDPTDIARVLGTTPRSVTRWQADGTDPSRREVLGRLLELKAVLDLAVQVLRPIEAAMFWLRTPHSLLDWDKPLDLIRDGKFKRVITSLEALAEGVCS